MMYDLVETSTGALILERDFEGGAPSSMNLPAKDRHWQVQDKPQSDEYHTVEWDEGTQSWIKTLRAKDAVLIAKKRALTVEYRDRLSCGCDVQVDSDNIVRFASDDDAQGQLARLILRLESAGGTQKFRTTSGDRVEADLTTAQFIYEEVETFVSNLRAREFDHDLNLDALSTAQEIYNYDLESGW